MKKFDFGTLFVIVILLCAILALTSYTTASSEISYDAPTNKISKLGTVQKQHYIFGEQKGVVIHRRARPKKNSSQSLKKNTFFIFGFMSLLLLIIIVQY